VGTYLNEVKVAGKKLDYAKVKSNFEKENYHLLTVEPINSSTKLEYICPNGHKHSIHNYSWLQGKRCPYCARVAKPTITSIKQLFELEGYTLLSTEYVNAHTKLDSICSEGHKHYVKWTDWQQGKRCPTCADIKNSGPGHHNWITDRSSMEYCEAWQDQEYKKDIRERDGNRCLNPYCASEHPEDLNIHHINYDKKDCHFKNLITVCRSCNAKANTDRGWHKDWYQALLYNRYGYTY